MRALVTGGAGFIGSNLADRLAGDGAEVVVFDALSRPGVEANLDWLVRRHGRQVVPARDDVRDAAALKRAVRGCDVVFHLAAQVAVTTSLVDPVDDFEINVRGALNTLEAARPDRTPVVFASTNKVYGDLGDVALELGETGYRPCDAALRERGVGEARPLEFHTPYGCSKGAADQYVLDYARSFELPTCVLRMSCIYGPRQLGTEDQGWVAHFAIRALQGEPVSIYGDGRQVRDVLFVDDAVNAYLAAFRRIRSVAGKAFNLGGGPRNAISLLQLIAHLETLLRRRIQLEFGPWRQGDQRYYVSDTTLARTVLGLAEPREWRTGVAALLDWLVAERDLQSERRHPAEPVS